MKFHPLAAACLLAFSEIPLQAQWLVPGETEGKFDSCRNFAGPQPLLNLPVEIEGEDGRLTCFADFDHVKGGWIPIYLINRTTRPIAVPLVDGQPNFKAYRELADGNWERVQPIGGFVMCGESIRVQDIPPGMFAQFEAAIHPAGEHQATIRYGYASVDSLVTNSGPGFWDPEERDIAQTDLSSLSEHPLWFGFPMDDPIPPEYKKPLEREEIDRALAVIQLLLDYRESRAARLWAARIARKSGISSTGWSALSRDKAAALGDGKPNAAKDPADFADRCLAYLGEDRKGMTFGSPATFPDFLWMALASAGSQVPGSASLPWRRIFETMEGRFAKAASTELDGMSYLLANELRANEFVNSEFLLKGMTSANRNFQARCVTLLLQRGLRKEMTAVAQTSAAGVKFGVLRAIIANPDPREETLIMRYGPINDFILACAKEEPGKTLDAIYEGSGRKTNLYLEPGLSLALEPHMIRTASKGWDSLVEIADYSERDRMQRMLKMAIDEGHPGRRDFPLLRKLAGSKAYYSKRITVSENGKTLEKTERIYFMADLARGELMKAGEVP